MLRLKIFSSERTLSASGITDFACIRLVIRRIFRRVSVPMAAMSGYPLIAVTVV